MSNQTITASRLTAARDALRTRRAAAAARRSLERDLAAYRTPSERLELDCILARDENANAEDIRQLVYRNRAA